MNLLNSALLKSTRQTYVNMMRCGRLMQSEPGMWYHSKDREDILDFLRQFPSDVQRYITAGVGRPSEPRLRKTVDKLQYYTNVLSLKEKQQLLAELTQ